MTDQMTRVLFTSNIDLPAVAEELGQKPTPFGGWLTQMIGRGEAMLLGAPTVSAYAGGAPSMARDEVEALFYRPDDPVMLAFQIRRIFEDPALAARLSKAARARAQRTHDPESNLSDLIAAYEAITSDSQRENA